MEEAGWPNSLIVLCLKLADRYKHLQNFKTTEWQPCLLYICEYSWVCLKLIWALSYTPYNIFLHPSFR